MGGSDIQPNRARVLLVEDDQPIRDALDVAFRREGYEVSSQADGTEIEAVTERFCPDLAILDMRLPVGPDGVAIARALRGSSDLPVVFLTGADGMDERLAGFDAGADDYVLKPFSMAELLARSRALLRRSGRLSSAVWQVGDLVVDEGARRVVRGGVVIDVTATEYDLLAVLVQHPGQVLSKFQLLSRVRGSEAYDPNLIEVHISALRRKLEAHGPRLVHTVRSMGYVLRA